MIIEIDDESIVILNNEDTRREVFEYGDHILPIRDHCGRNSIIFGTEGQSIFVDIGILNGLRSSLFD